MARGRREQGLPSTADCLDCAYVSCLQVIVTSYLFPDAKFSFERLKDISSLVGKDKLVVDVRCGQDVSLRELIPTVPCSCRRREDKWFVAMNKWQTVTDMEVNRGQ